MKNVAGTLGDIVWGEFGDWGRNWVGLLTGKHQKPDAAYITSTITALDKITRGMYLATKAMDTTRPVLDTPGYSPRVPEADIYDSHDYPQDPDTFATRHAGLVADSPDVNGPDSWGLPERFAGTLAWSIPYRGQPYFVSKFGGAWWNPDGKEGEDSWG